ncbi:MAG: EamA family transporter [Candidatus Cloacimonetes bacterium]|nr:EamA family transporter [Candidatus Cloacimonadota bacterium]
MQDAEWYGGTAAVPHTRERSSRLLGALLVVVAAALWATFGLFAKRLYAAGFTALELATIRNWVGFAGIALLALPRPSRLRIRTRDLPFFAAYGILAFATFALMYLLTLRQTSVAIAVSLLYTAPAFVVMLSALLWRERLPATNIVALVLVLAGVVLVTGALTALRAGAASLGVGALLTGLCSGFAYGLYTLFSKTATDRYPDPIAPVFWMFAFATLAMTLIEPPFEAMMRPHGEWLALIGLGLVPTVFPYLLYLQALRWLRASTAAMLASVEPVIAALLAALLLGEGLDAARVVGIAMIATAAALLAREKPAVQDPKAIM